MLYKFHTLLLTNIDTVGVISYTTLQLLPFDW